MQDIQECSAVSTVYVQPNSIRIRDYQPSAQRTQRTVLAGVPWLLAGEEGNASMHGTQCCRKVAVKFLLRYRSDTVRQASSHVFFLPLFQICGNDVVGFRKRKAVVVSSCQAVSALWKSALPTRERALLFHEPWAWSRVIEHEPMA